MDRINVANRIKRFSISISRYVYTARSDLKEIHNIWSNITFDDFDQAITFVGDFMIQAIKEHPAYYRRQPTIQYDARSFTILITDETSIIKILINYLYDETN